VTTDLLSVWTDPDTAMHAVGTSLGIFDNGRSDPGAVGPSGSPLRTALFDVLLALVDEGELEKRACGDGRYAFRWREDVESTAVCTDATSARLEACLGSMPREMPWSVGTGLVPARDPNGPGPLATMAPLILPAVAPLLLPAVSCVLALAAFVLLGNVVGIAVLVALALAGVVGLARRVPLAGFWTMGLVVAAFLMRVS
jgi:hypothetical protein